MITYHLSGRREYEIAKTNRTLDVRVATVTVRNECDRSEYFRLEWCQVLVLLLLFYLLNIAYRCGRLDVDICLQNVNGCCRCVITLWSVYRCVDSHNDTTVQWIPSAGLPFGDRRRQGTSNQFFIYYVTLLGCKMFVVSKLYRRFNCVYSHNWLSLCSVKCWKL